MQVTVRVPIEVAAASTGARTVLVVSDDSDWRALTGRVLEREGYRVLLARHTGEALIESIRHSSPIHLLLTDGATGQRRSDLSPRIFVEHPQAKLLHLPSRPPTREDLVAAVRGAMG